MDIHTHAHARMHAHVCPHTCTTVADNEDLLEICAAEVVGSCACVRACARVCVCVCVCVHIAVPVYVPSPFSPHVLWLLGTYSINHRTYASPSPPPPSC